MADQLDTSHSSPLTVARACCTASPNGSGFRRLWSTNVSSVDAFMNTTWSQHDAILLTPHRPDDNDSLRDAVQSVLGDDDEGEVDESDEATLG